MRHDDLSARDGNGLPARAHVAALVDQDTGVAELSLSGRWSHSTWLRAQTLMRQCLAEHPAGLLLDLLDLHDSRASSVPLWLTAASHAGRARPRIPMAVCVAEGAPLTVRLATMGIPGRLPVFGTTAAARVALADVRPRTDQVRLRLPPQPGVAADARQMVTAACREWAVPALIDRARLVVSELVINAVEHAGTPIELLITRLGPLRYGMVRQNCGVHLAVCDLDHNLPRLNRPLPAEQARGMGLHLVEGAAWAWGALPTRTGKMVWATLWQQHRGSR
jgi:anti-sigma regulatory factor (Ser/Thr protein kinase)